MEKLRRSFRGSFRRRKDSISVTSEATKPHLWQNDEVEVRAGTCCFHVKYLGCVEVFESRGMQVCEEALKVLKNFRRRPVKAVLHISGDGLRVVEDDTKGLIVDQTIEKVSFCAPDRSHERGFSYICRDGTTRRWMCHGFLALKESGERLSHAVGCAFAVCLERKQKRDKECNVTMKFDSSNSSFTRNGSFRVEGLTDKLHDSANMNTNNVLTSASIIEPVTPKTPVIPAEIVKNNYMNTINSRKENIPVRSNISKVADTHAIERPRANISLLQRQGSFRCLTHLNQASPFKRQLSLRLCDLPSNAERTNRSHSLELSSNNPNMNSSSLFVKAPVSTIPESAPLNTTTPPVNVADQVNAMCQQLSQGLSFLVNNDELVRNRANDQTSGAQTTSANDVFDRKMSLDSSQLQPASYYPDFEARRKTIKLQHSSLPTSDGGTLLTPPTTNSITATTDLPKPEQWLDKVSQLEFNESEPLAISWTKRAHMMSKHNRAYSLNSTEAILNREAAREIQKNAFSIDWASLSVDPTPESINTNPFLSNIPRKVTPDESTLQIS